MDEIETPALVVDLDIAENNLAAMQQRADRRNFALWPHTKTHKSSVWARRQQDLGAQGLTVAKLGEAEVLRAAGLTRLLIAYPLIGVAKARRLADLLTHGVEARVALDSPNAVDCVAQAAQAAQTNVDVLVEVDTGFHRVGRSSPRAVVGLARYVSERSNIRFAGIFSFAGHIGAALDEAGRQKILQDEAAILAESRDLLEQAGLAPAVISVGGTHHAARMEEIPLATEIRPGTYVYNDRATLLADSCTEGQCAATVLVTVVSKSEGWAVVDGGSKAFSSDAHRAGGHGLVKAHPEWSLDRLSEEHGVLTWSDDVDGPDIGERLQIIPNHICTVVNLFDRVYGVRAGNVERLLKVEGRGLSQ